MREREVAIWGSRARDPEQGRPAAGGRREASSRLRRLALAAVAACCSLVGGLAFASTPALAVYENKCEPTINFCTEGSSPAGVAVDNSTGPNKGDVYVVELGSHQLVQYEATGKKKASIELGETTPIWNAVDSSTATPGDIYVGLFGAGEVVKYEPSGTKVAAFKVTGLTSPSGVGVDPRNGDVYVAERAGNVKVYNFKGEEVAGESWADGIGEPGSVAVDKNGDVYVINEYKELVEFPVGKAAEREANRKVIESEGEPYAVAIDPSTGDIFVYNHGTSLINLVASEIVVLNEKSEPIGETFGATLFAAHGSAGIGVYGGTKTVYASNLEGNDNFIFEPSGPTEPLLRVVKTGAGSGTITSTPAGINCGTECEHKYKEAEVVTLTEAPSVGSKFGGWEGCESEPTPEECKVTMSAAKTVKAKFELPKFKLAVTKSAEGEVIGSEAAMAIKCGATCETEVEEGATATLEATPAEHYSFVKWTEGPCAGESKNPCPAFTMPKAEVKAAAEYAKITTFPLNVFVSGEGEVKSAGTIACVGPADTGTCVEQVKGEVELIAKAVPGKTTFVGWLGCKRLAETTCKVNVAAATEVTAVFLNIGEKGETGSKGSTGAAGKNGTNGTNGTNGAEGKEGKEGKAGATGATGAGGATGPAGPEGKQGPAGKVTCKVQQKGKKVKVTCTVKVATASAARVHWSLSRHGHAVAHGAARGGDVRLNASGLPAGRYRLTLISGSGRHTTIRSESVTLP